MIDAQAHLAQGFWEERSTVYEPKVGLSALACLVIITTLWVAGNGPALRGGALAVATVFGLFLYLRHPIVYLQYSLWLWMLAPLVRRVVDLRFGFMDSNVIMLAPLLVSGIAILTLVRKNRLAAGGIPAVFTLCGIAILYGFVVGGLLHPSVETAYAFLNWFCPLVFGLHLYLNWSDYPKNSDAIGRTFLWAVLILGAYGIYQFLDPPAWDQFWLENVRMGAPGSSFGEPEPLLIRVWSTINAPGPFANVMMVGLLLLFGVRSRLKLPVALAGYVALLLSAVRSAWLGWAVGLFWIIKSATPRVIVRMLFSMALLLICLLPVVTQPHLAKVIGARFETFSDLEHDESISARSRMYRILAGDALRDPFGQGLNNLEVARGMALDSGLLSLVFSTGWLGSALCAAGVLSLFLRKRRDLAQQDEFFVAAKAAMIALFAQIMGGNVFVGITGAILWMLAAMYLAAHQFYEQEFCERGDITNAAASG